ncbi:MULTISPECIES: HAD-IIIC family phosphatase [Amycolatopsis]|uniref:HAD-IIIC family phosphatase n=2 Tax=Amycolatopsis TaxID=1813 RepID=A0ABW5I1U3_9PSEU
MSAVEKPGIAVAGTFTLDAVTGPMAAVLAEREGGRPLAVAPYGQVLEALHDPGSPLRGHNGVNFLLLRPEDFFRGKGFAESRERADTMLAELVTMLERLPDLAVATWFVAVLPASPAVRAQPEASQWVQEAGARITAVAEAVPAVHPVTVDDLEIRYGVTEVHDEYADRIGHLPYTDEYCAALGTQLVRLAASVWAKPKKVVVLDCDNTLWAGVCGEDGARGVQVTPAHRRLQEFMLEQRAQGKLLCLCSRNNEADVKEVFDRNPGMVLAWEHVSAHRIGWNPKAHSLRELAEDLDLSLSSFVFVDDDVVECASVRAQLPEVTVLELAHDAEGIDRQLAETWAFDQLVVTEEDRLRADWYSTRGERVALCDSSADYQDFLDRCEIEVGFTELTEDMLDRAAQLTARTTQFNLAGTVYAVGELRGLLSAGSRGWTVRVSDRFGDYGTVGLVVAEFRDDAVELPVFLLSCRVLNRRVEQEVLRFAADKAAEAGASALRLPVRPTARNAPARLFVEQAAGVVLGADDEPVTVTVPVREWLRLPA